jgi:hypothetical protein
MTAFWANYHYHSVLQFNAPKESSSLKLDIRTDTFAAGLEETHQTLRQHLQQDLARKPKYAGGKEGVFEVGDNVWLSTRHVRTTRPTKKIYYKRTEPDTVRKVINKNASKLDLPYMLRKDIVLHVMLLSRYTPVTDGQSVVEQQPMIIDDSDEWEVDQILDSKQRYRKLHYLVQWVGYSYIRTSWEPAGI